MHKTIYIKLIFVYTVSFILCVFPFTMTINVLEDNHKTNFFH